MTGELPLDSDLQNNPEDVPLMLSKLEEGYDMVCGWRYNRRDPLLKKFISKVHQERKEIMRKY